MSKLVPARDKVFWDALTDFIPCDEALRQLTMIFSNGVKAQSPFDSNITVDLTFTNPETVADHILFKRDHLRSGQGSQRPEDYKPERGARIKMISETLARPNTIYQQIKRKKNGKVVDVAEETYVYCCEVGRQFGTAVFFVVFVHRPKPQKLYVVGSAYPCSKAEIDGNLSAKHWRRVCTNRVEEKKEEEPEDSPKLS